MKLFPPTGRRAHLFRTTAVAVAVALFGILDPGFAEDAGSPDPVGVPSMEVTFDDLGVISRGGRFVVPFEIRPSSWEGLATEGRVLWMRLRIPTDARDPGFPYYTYTLRVDERRGRLEFPRWLSTFGARRVGLCPLATGPGDHLGLGRGWVCREVRWYAVRRQRPAVPSGGVSIELLYHALPMYVPSEVWSEPAIPGLESPLAE